MKKTAMFLLVLALLIGCVACSASPATTAKPADTNVETADTPATATEPADTTAPADETPSGSEPAEVEVPDQYKSVADVWSGITLSESPYGYNYDLNYNGRSDKTDSFLHGAGSWPICDWGEIQLSVWYSMNESVAQFSDDWDSGENVSFAVMQERTGVDLTFDICSDDAAPTQFPLMVNSGDWSDIIVGGMTYYAGGLDKAYNDEFLLDMTPYIEECAPNYLHWISKTPGNLKEAVNDNGQYLEMYKVGDGIQSAYLGPVIRKDWREAAGLETPVTIQDWHDLLVVFRDQFSTGEPLTLNTSGIDYSQCFNGAYGVYFAGDNFYIQQNGTVIPSIATDGMREYLELMSSWYNEGLIDTDFASQTNAFGLVTNNEVGATGTMIFTMAGDFYQNLGAEPGFFFEIVPNPIKEEGAERHVYVKGENTNSLAHWGNCIAASCAYPAEAIRMLDWCYTEEGSTIMEYGIEGLTFTFDENGHRVQTELIHSNPEMSMTNAQERYMTNNHFGIFFYEREYDVLDESKTAHIEAWGPRGDWNIDGTLSYSPEEVEERSALIVDITTYISEFSAKVISGITELNDATWNEYLETLESYNIDRITEITQAAYDRYQQR